MLDLLGFVCFYVEDEARRHLEDLDTQCAGCSVWLFRLRAHERGRVSLGSGSDMAPVGLEVGDPGNISRM